MQVATNSSLVQGRVRLAGILHLSALAVLGLSLFISFQSDEAIIYSYLGIFLGLILYQIARSNLQRWGPRHRQDEALKRNLKGLDNRHTLVAFPATNLPDYLLVGPSGVTVLLTRNHRGLVTCRSDRWSHLDPTFFLLRIFRQPLGSPSVDARNAILTIKRHLATQLEGDRMPSVDAVIVFTHPQVRLRIDGSSIPVTTLKELRHHLRRVKGALSPDEVAEIRDALTRFSS